MCAGDSRRSRHANLYVSNCDSSLCDDRMFFFLVLLTVQRFDFCRSRNVGAMAWHFCDTAASRARSMWMGWNAKWETMRRANVKSGWWNKFLAARIAHNNCISRIIVFGCITEEPTFSYLFVHSIFEFNVTIRKYWNTKCQTKNWRVYRLACEYCDETHTRCNVHIFNLTLWFFFLSAWMRCICPIKIEMAALSPEQVTIWNQKPTCTLKYKFCSVAFSSFLCWRQSFVRSDTPDIYGNDIKQYKRDNRAYWRVIVVSYVRRVSLDDITIDITNFLTCW